MTSTTKREPIFNIPAIILALIGLMAAVHMGRSLLSPNADWDLLSELAFVPARLSLWLGQATMGEVLQSAFGETAARLDIDQLPQKLRALLELSNTAPLTVISHGMLHSSVGHLLTNSLWLLAFGSPVARRLGAPRFVILMVAAILGGAVIHWFVDPLAITPMIGASAGVSGAMAAAVRFVFAPSVRLGELGQDEKVRAIHAQSMVELIANPRALAFILFWFASNILFGTGLISVSGDEASIAWQAHIGGFVTGLMLFPLLDKPVHR